MKGNYQKTELTGHNRLRGSVTFDLERLAYRDSFRNHALRYILPFWANYSIDKAYGGYITHLSRNGSVYDYTAKMVAMQGRMVYGFSVGYGMESDSSYLQYARQGVSFLIDKAWDRRYGGWYWALRRTGLVKDDSKHPLAQIFMIMGLLEYYKVTRDKVALKYAIDTYEMLDRFAWDNQYDGYYSYMRRDWTVESDAKTLCTQIDMAVALLSLHSITNDEAYLIRLKQLGDIFITRMWDPIQGCVRENFYRDWTYNPHAIYNPMLSGDIISVGHNLKTAWFLLRLSELVKDERYLAYAKKLIDYCIKYGWDCQNDGFYEYCSRDGVLASKVKWWWPECEGMLALLLAYKLTRDSTYWNHFKKVTHFCFTHFYDDIYGEWFSSCQANGTPKDTRKGGPWKAAYHTIETCFYVYHYLNSGGPTVEGDQEITNNIPPNI